MRPSSGLGSWSSATVDTSSTEASPCSTWEPWRHLQTVPDFAMDRGLMGWCLEYGFIIYKDISFRLAGFGTRTWVQHLQSGALHKGFAYFQRLRVANCDLWSFIYVASLELTNSASGISDCATCLSDETTAGATHARKLVAKVLTQAIFTKISSTRPACLPGLLLCLGLSWSMIGGHPRLTTSAGSCQHGLPGVATGYSNWSTRCSSPELPLDLWLSGH